MSVRERAAAQALLRRICEGLRGSLPGDDPQHWRVPVRAGAAAQRLVRERMARGPVRPAAVLVPLLERSGEPAVLLTRRASHLKAHAGQISFPGGSLEPGDAGPVHAALREAEEEVGIGAGEVEVLGFLDTFVTGTGFAITPVVGLVAPAATPCANPDEVAEVFEVPLDFLIDPANHGATSRTVAGHQLEFFEIAYQRYRIWGATAGIIVGLYEKMNIVRTGS